MPTAGLVPVSAQHMAKRMTPEGPEDKELCSMGVPFTAKVTLHNMNPAVVVLEGEPVFYFWC